MMILRDPLRLLCRLFAMAFLAISLTAMPAQAQFAAVMDTPGGDTPPLENPSMAMNLAAVRDWGTQNPFLNIAKTMRPLFGHLPGQWGGLSHDDLAQAGYLDAQGWPLAVPAGATLATVFLTEQPAEATSMAGRYRLTFSGTADLTLGNVRVVRRQANEIWFDYTPTGRNLVHLQIKAMDPNDPLRDLAVVHERNIPLFEAGALFNPDWIKLVRDFRVLRFMDWMRTNGSSIQSWDQRALPGDFSYTTDKGVPLELMVALANEIGADPWFTMPHQADDTYVRSFASLVEQTLDPKLKAYVEYSNEMWNFGFSQAKWAAEQANELWGRKAGSDGWMQFSGLRAAQIANIWSDVFGKQTEGRLVRVMAVHTANLGLEKAFLEGRLWADERKAMPKRIFDAYAVTGYFYLSYPKGEMLPRVKAQMAETASKPGGDDELYDSFAANIRQTSLPRLLNDWWPYHALVANEHAMNLIMYEGGTHVVALGMDVQDADLTEALIGFNYSPQIEPLYLDLLEGWRDVGGSVFAAFQDVATPSKWGSWGHLRHLQDQTGRWDILAANNRRMGPLTENRLPGTFLHGVTLMAGEEAQTLEGTPQMDTLIGGGGDDMLVSLGGNDRLHGRSGIDVALLPGRLRDYSFSENGPRVEARSDLAVVSLRDIEFLMFDSDPSFIVAIGDLLPE